MVVLAPIRFQRPQDHASPKMYVCSAIKMVTIAIRLEHPVGSIRTFEFTWNFAGWYFVFKAVHPCETVPRMVVEEFAAQ